MGLSKIWIAFGQKIVAFLNLLKKSENLDFSPKAKSKKLIVPL